MLLISVLISPAYHRQECGGGDGRSRVTRWLVLQPGTQFQSPNQLRPAEIALNK